MEYINILDVAPGQMVQWRTQFWVLVEVREPRHGLASAHGAMVADVDCWAESQKRWCRHTITVWPGNRDHWDCYVLSEADQATLRKSCNDYGSVQA